MLDSGRPAWRRINGEQDHDPLESERMDLAGAAKLAQRVLARGEGCVGGDYEAHYLARAVLAQGVMLDARDEWNRNLQTELKAALNERDDLQERISR